MWAVLVNTFFLDFSETGLVRVFSQHFLINPNAMIFIGTVAAWRRHIFSISIARSSYLIFFSYSLTAMFWSLGALISTKRHGLRLKPLMMMSGRFAWMVTLSFSVGGVHTTWWEFRSGSYKNIDLFYRGDFCTRLVLKLRSLK